METHLQKFIDRVQAGSSDGENSITAEYTSIKYQDNLLKQKYNLTTQAGGVKENLKKNRYKDILPYDQTRVILSPTTSDFNTDYINASYIKGATGSKTYIATQGPLKNTIVDFWRMIWQNDIRVIIMACKEIELEKKKCEVYWSPLDGASTFGPFTVSTVEESPTNEEVIVRKLAVKHSDETRTVFHFQYTAWPDHGIPDMADGILGMMKMVHVRQSYHPGPLLVHCSAGCGRTGVICAIDIVNDLLHKKKIGEDFSIMELVLELRRQRPAAVQTKEQYEFVFHTVAQMFQKVLQESSQKNQRHNLIQNSQSHYANVLPPKPALRSLSIGYETQNTRKPPALRPRSSHPRSSNMNDTYAVVNKIRQPGASPRLVPHHYDNDNNQKSPTSDLYSIVKPKNRAVANTPVSMVPVYDRTHNRRASADTEYRGYEPMPADRHSSSDDDYEYVPNPIRETSTSISTSSSSSSHCSPGIFGFNFRVNKPKGPRAPPSQWNRPER